MSELRVLGRRKIEDLHLQEIKLTEFPRRFVGEIHPRFEPVKVLARHNIDDYISTKTGKGFALKNYVKVSTVLFNGKECLIQAYPDKTTVRIKDDEFVLFYGAIAIGRADRVIHRDGSVDVKYQIHITTPMDNDAFYISKLHFKRDLLDKIEANCPYFQFEKTLSNFVALFNAFAQALVSQHDFLTFTTYDFSGWVRNKFGTWQYIHGSMPNVSAKMKLPKAGPSDFVSGLQALLALLGNDPRLYLVFLFAHMGFVARIFSLAGLPPRFSLYVVGRSGSFKSSLLKVLSGGIFETEDNATCECRFTDTKASINSKILGRQDRNLLVDDYHPTSTKTQRSLMRMNLDTVLRTYGDGESEGKLGPNRKETAKERIYGVAWMTGESTDFSAYSDILRVITVPLDEHCVDPTLLAVLQDNLDIVRKYFAAFVRYLEPRFDYIRQRIALSKGTGRTEWRNLLQLTAGRYVDAALSLYLVNNFIWDAAAVCGVQDAETKKQQGKVMIIDFFKSLLVATQAQKPTAIFATVLKEAFHNGKLAVASSKERYLDGFGEGYLDERHLVLNTTYANKTFESFCNDHNLAIVIPERSELVDAGIIVAGRDRATAIRKGNERPPIYVFKNEVLGIETSAENEKKEDTHCEN